MIRQNPLALGPVLGCLAVVLISTAANGKTPKGDRCREVPQAKGEVFRYGKSLSIPEVKWTVQTEELVGMDFDGSGDKVYRVPLLAQLSGLKESSSLGWDLYILRGACAVHLGSYRGHPKPDLSKSKTNGFFDFSVLRANPFADEQDRRHGDGLSILTRYTFDGKRYVGGPPERR